MNEPDVDPLNNLLLRLRGERLLYFQNPGNAGDAFIACSTYQRLERLGCLYEVIKSDCPIETTRDRVVLYGGGGNLVPIYQSASGFVTRHHSHARLFVVLPHTIRGNEALLTTFGDNVHLFCRERASFEHVIRHAPRARVQISEDVAFGFDPQAARSRATKLFWPFLSSPSFAWRNLKRTIRTLPANLGRLAGDRHLVALRTDSEKTEVSRPMQNIDVSNVFNSALDPIASLEGTYRLMRFMQRFEKVTTNRLHIAIMAGILAKEVHFLPNSYGKNRAVYEFSMANRFPNVLWQEAGLL